MFDSYFSDFTRYSSDRAKKITISYDDMACETVPLLVENFGFEFLTTSESLARVLGFGTTPDQVIRQKELSAHRNGDRVFYLKLGEHSGWAFDITKEHSRREYDSGCVGVVIVSKEAWECAFKRSTFARTHVLRTIRNIFVDLVEGVLNGTVYRADVWDGDDIIDGIGDCLSCEEALEAMQNVFPDVLYRDDQFIAHTTYELVC